jgi:spore coat protein H
MIRNKLSLDLFQSFGTLAPASQFIRININDQYQGVYLRLESVDDLFLKKRDLPLGAIYYAVNNNANFSLISRITNDAKNSLMDGYQCKCGTIFDDECLIDFINMINNTAPDEFASKISNYLSVDRYLRWLAIAVCTQNMDGFVKNYALYRNPHTQLFEIIPWDYDATFGRDWNGEIMEFDTVPLEGYNTLTKKLLEVPEFRNLYRRLMEELLDTLFTPAFLEPKILDLTQSLRPHLQFDPYKSTQLDQFDVEPEFILQFIKDRNQFLRNHLKDLD